MGPLGLAARKRMPLADFGLKQTRGFPMNNATHDRLAIGGATRSERAGNISPATEQRIKAEARAKLAATKKRGR